MISVINSNTNNTILITAHEQNISLVTSKLNIDITLSLRTRKQFAFQITLASKYLQQKRSNTISVTKIILVHDQSSYLN